MVGFVHNTSDRDKMAKFDTCLTFLKRSVFIIDHTNLNYSPFHSSKWLQNMII